MEVYERIVELAAKTSDTYMADIYGEERWGEQIAELVEHGYTDEAVEWIVRSKIARWANDYELSMVDYINRYVGEAKLRTWMREDGAE